MLTMSYDTESKSRNADFISIAPKGETTHYILRVASVPSKCVRCAPQSGNPQPSARRAVKLKNPPAIRPVNPKNLSPCPLSASEHNLPPSGGHNPRAKGPSTFPFTTLLYNSRRQPPPFFKNLRRSRHHNPRPERPSNLRTLRTFGAKPRQPSLRRRVLT